MGDSAFVSSRSLFSLSLLDNELLSSHDKHLQKSNEVIHSIQEVFFIYWVISL
jgi:hypothetical protein